jgi:hypothetical protein
MEQALVMTLLDARPADAKTERKSTPGAPKENANGAPSEKTSP